MSNSRKKGQEELILRGGSKEENWKEQGAKRCACSERIKAASSERRLSLLCLIACPCLSVLLAALPISRIMSI